MSDSKLPSFRKPPVIETVLGVQFDPIPGFTTAHLGAFWKWLVARSRATTNEKWTVLSDAPLIEPAFERFDSGPDGTQLWSPELMIQVGAIRPARLQIRNDRKDAMIQVQNTRLHYNWIGQRGEEYPRYTTVRPKFDAVYALFLEFLEAEGLAGPNDNQWEVTYVNHIPHGTVWQTPTDWATLFHGLLGSYQKATEVRVESVGGSWHFEIPPQRGRLHVDLKHAKVSAPGSEELIRLTLTARGPIANSGADHQSLARGLDLGRRVIVRAFWELTSPEAHKVWGLTQ